MLPACGQGIATGLNGLIPVARNPAISCTGVIECCHNSDSNEAKTFLSTFAAFVCILCCCRICLQAVFIGPYTATSSGCSKCEVLDGRVNKSTPSL